ncbi:MAG: hypothetical protein ACQSGP_28405, partial [Frankia sp.]
HTLRMETLLRSFLFWLMAPDELTHPLERERQVIPDTADILRSYAATKDSGAWGTSRQTRAQRIAIEAGVRVNEALATWAEWALETDVMSAEDFGAARAPTDAPPGDPSG